MSGRGLWYSATTSLTDLQKRLGESCSSRLHVPRLQRRYGYAAAAVEFFRVALQVSFTLVAGLPSLAGIVRDPNDDMVACAVAGAASHIVMRDLDLLSLVTYEGIAMVTPEVFLSLLRSEANR